MGIEIEELPLDVRQQLPVSGKIPALGAAVPRSQSEEYPNVWVFVKPRYAILLARQHVLDATPVAKWNLGLGLDLGGGGGEHTSH